MFNEFKKFALRGNVFGMAIGIMLGSAISNIVNSLVEDILMPIIGVFTGGIDFANKSVTLSVDSSGQANVLKYGQLLQYIFNFLIIALFLFLVVKGISKVDPTAATDQLLNTEEAPKPEMRDCPFCLEPVLNHASRCPHCTSELEPVATSTANSPQTT